MDNMIQFPEGFRYSSDIKLFKRMVDCAGELIKKGKMVILYQFLDAISANVFISQNEFEQEYPDVEWDDFIDILNNEIIYLLRQNFNEKIGNDSGLKSYLEKNNVSGESQKKIIALQLEKRQYVSDCLGGEREKNRYNLKKRSVLKKLSSIDYELSRTVDEEEILYAAIRMSVDSTLENKELSAMLGTAPNQSKEDITFVCDKLDIEYLIKQLEKIRKML